MNIDPQIAQPTLTPILPGNAVNGREIGISTTQSHLTDHARFTKIPKARGRQPKNPHAQSIRFQCRDVDDQERQLREYLQAPTAPAEHATLEFVYPVSSAFTVYSADIKNKRNTQQDEKTQHLYGKLDRTAISVIDALAVTEDSKDQMRRQKAIAKICIEACERADGYRYSFHNNWLSREDEACRFSYFCNDSTLNKGRAANEGAGTIGKKIRKPVYDCQGLIAIKFSQTKQSLEVHYRHLPIHKTYAERAPPPRKDSKRYKLMEVFEPQKLPVDVAERPRTRLSQPDGDPQRRPRKRRTVETPSEAEISRPVEPLYDDGINYLVAFLEQGPTNVDEQLPHVEEESVDTTVRGRSNSEIAAAVLSYGLPQNPVQNAVQHAAQHSAQPSASSAMTNTPSGPVRQRSQSAALTWVRPNSAKKGSRTRSSGVTGQSLQTSSTHTNVDTPVSNSFALSELEALKAKLEAAEQRIKELEAEKHAVTVTEPSSHVPPLPPQPPPPPPMTHAVGPPLAHNTQHHTGPPYPYPYTAPSYAFPPQAMVPMNYVPQNNLIQQPQHQQPYQSSSTHDQTQSQTSRTDDASSKTVNAQNHVARSKEGPTQMQNKASAVRGFVAYTPKPPRPVLDAQRQDANPSTNHGRGTSTQ